MTNTMQTKSGDAHDDKHAFGSSGPVRVTENPDVRVEIDKEDLTYGKPNRRIAAKGRYEGFTSVSKTLAVKEETDGVLHIIPHSNVKIKFFKDGRQVKTGGERAVRQWTIVPLRADAAVDNLRNWRIEALHHPDFLPFSPMRASLTEDPPSVNWISESFHTDDEPGNELVGPGTSGLLQEWVVGHPDVGGAYFQTYVITDSNRTRVLSTNALTFSAEDYRSLSAKIADPAFQTKYLHKLLYMPKIVHNQKTNIPSHAPRLAPQ
jgi:hypothetical protein